MDNPDQSKRRVAILGGGIAGLSAAYTLALARRRGLPIEEHLLERSLRLGGSISTERLDGFVVEGGPDSFLAEKPEAVALCRELGLGDSLIGSNDAERRTYILHHDRLIPLPDGLMLLVPTRLLPVIMSPLLPISGKLAIFNELRTPPTGDEPRADESVASFVRRHFGDAMVENIADPLLAGVFGGDSEQLSVRAVLPRFLEMERKHGSLTRAALDLRRQRRARAGSGAASSLFITLKDGLDRMVEAVTARLERTRLHLGERVSSIERVAPGTPGRSQYRVRYEPGGALEADALILGLPTYEGARLLAPSDAVLGEALAAVPYSSGLTVSLGYDAPMAQQLPPGFGFLVPRAARRRLIACTFVHQKFRHHAPEGSALIRCFLGGVRDPEVLNLSDAEITTLVRAELGSILKLPGLKLTEPRFVRICRWPASMPQYTLGHEERVATVRARLANLPGVFFAGNAISGIGLSDCIRTGRAASEAALEFLGLAERRA